MRTSHREGVEFPPSSLKRRGAVLGLFAILSLLSLNCSPASPPNVVLISIDTLHAGHLSCYGYQRIQTPNIDLLAEEGVLFENAATSVPLTLPAHASIFTGRNPLRHGVVDNFTSHLDDKEETLAETLKAHGYVTGAFVGAYVLDSDWGTAQGFDTYFDDFDATESNVVSVEANQRSGHEVLERALTWVRQQNEQPFFLFVHFFDPHQPYDPPEPYRANCKQEPVSCYDGEVAFVDDLVGRLFSELGSLSLLDESLAILVGDHGESLGDHGESTHGFFLYDATIKVPLIIKGPGIPGSARIRAQVRTVDILPTVLDLLELPLPSELDGVSLRPLLFDPNHDLQLVAYIETQYPQLQFGWAPLSGLRNEHYKFVDAPRRELYDLTVDPEETHNLVDQRPDVAEEFANDLEMIRGTTAPTKKEPYLPDLETVKRLRALGYITSAVDVKTSNNVEDLDDPKDKIDVFNRLDEARVARREGDSDHALELLISVVEDDPEVMLAHLTLGNIYLDAGQAHKAEASFETALDRNPQNLEALQGLARTHKMLGQYQKAAEELERCLKLDPGRVSTALTLAEVRLALGQGQQAERLISGLEAGQQEVSTKLLLASSLVAQEKHTEAWEILEGIEQQRPTDESVLLSLGSLYLKAGDEERGIEAYQRAVGAPAAAERVGESKHEQSEMFNAIGHLLARHGDLSSAARAFRKAVQRDPSLASGHNNLGIVLARMTQFEAAEQAFQQAIEKAPNFAEAYYNLGNLYLQTGQTEQAVLAFQRAIDLRPDYTKARAKLEHALARAPKKH